MYLAFAVGGDPDRFDSSSSGRSFFPLPEENYHLVAPYVHQSCAVGKFFVLVPAS